MPEPLVLIIEDNALNRKLVRDVLEAHGYATIESETGEQGLALARRHRPSLVLLDIHLPGIDGMETFRQLRDDPQTASIPVVVVTASAMNAERARIETLGVDGYLTKPIDVRAFLECVTSLLPGDGLRP